jgi:hypothetical protein
VLFVPPLVLICFVVWFWKRESWRRRRLDALAVAAGWTFSPVHDEAVGRLCDFELFRDATDRYAFNTITGTVTLGPLACVLEMGDFSYAVDGWSESGKGGLVRRRFSYLMVRLPFRTTPDVRLRREGLGDTIARAAGFADIDFESDEFNRMWRVTASDKRFAYDLIHPRVMEYLVSLPPASRIELSAGHLCLTDGARRWTPDEFRRRLHWARNFVALWPAHLASGLAERSI